MQKNYIEIKIKEETRFFSESDLSSYVFNLVLSNDNYDAMVPDDKQKCLEILEEQGIDYKERNINVPDSLLKIQNIKYKRSDWINGKADEYVKEELNDVLFDRFLNEDIIVFRSNTYKDEDELDYHFFDKTNYLASISHMDLPFYNDNLIEDLKDARKDDFLTTKLDEYFNLFNNSDLFQNNKLLIKERFELEKRDKNVITLTDLDNFEIVFVGELIDSKLNIKKDLLENNERELLNEVYMALNINSFETNHLTIEDRAYKKGYESRNEEIKEKYNSMIPINEKIEKIIENMIDPVAKMKLEKEFGKLKEMIIKEIRFSYTENLTELFNKDIFYKMIGNREADKQLELISNDNVSINTAKTGDYVLMSDLTLFKEVNDKLGHEIGDEILKIFASTISENYPNAIHCRLGGDEFGHIFKSEEKDNVIDFKKFISENIALILQDRIPELKVNGLLPGAIAGSVIYSEDMGAKRTIQAADEDMLYNKYLNKLTHGNYNRAEQKMVYFNINESDKEIFNSLEISKKEKIKVLQEYIDKNTNSKSIETLANYIQSNYKEIHTLFDSKKQKNDTLHTSDNQINEEIEYIRNI